MSKVIIDPDRTKRWFFNEKLHREDGPAVEYRNGIKEWWFNGVCHREGGPAVEFPNGTKWWFVAGKCHREDGPAIELADGDVYWYLDDKEYSKEFWFEMLPEDSKMKALFSEHFIWSR